METVEQFKQQQLKTIEILQRLLSFVQNGEKFGIDGSNLIEKISKDITETESKKLKVALVGGFSEGKTSIVAAWSRNFDSETMKIDASESSDSVNVYHLNNFDIIDTPGLFGFKETSNQIKYKDITRQYVSEANLILYVMGPSNPIKDSHKGELQWLFNDLNLLPRTVFVISRFDEEVDIEDIEEYSNRLEIKKVSILSRLREFKLITESQEVPIVAIAANPFGEGFTYWLSNVEEYYRISHINDLQRATTEQIKKSGGYDALVLATSQSIVKDIIQRQMPVVRANMLLLNEETISLNKALADVQNEHKKLNRSISTARVELKEYIISLFTDLILQLKGTDIQTFDDFFEKNIGDEGLVLETNINNEFQRRVGTISSEILKVQTHFYTSVNHYNSMTEDLAKQGIKLGGDFLKNVTISNKTILAVRDFVMPSFKFKPWGAIKLAGKLTKGIAIFGSVLGLGVEAWESYSEKKQEEEFCKAKNLMKEKLEEQRKDYIEFIDNEEEFSKQFFPDYFELLEQIKDITIAVNDRQRLQEEFEIWKNEGEIIEGDFEVLIEKYEKIL